MGRSTQELVEGTSEEINILTYLNEIINFVNDDG